MARRKRIYNFQVMSADQKYTESTPSTNDTAKALLKAEPHQPSEGIACKTNISSYTLVY